MRPVGIRNYGRRAHARVFNLTCYLLHFYPPLKHAKHYIGFTTQEYDFKKLRRIVEHKRGTQKGSKLIRAALAAGCTIKLAQVWPGADRNFERWLKKKKNAASFCPCCNGKRKYEYQPKEFVDENKNKSIESHAVRPETAIPELPAIKSDMPDDGVHHHPERGCEDIAGGGQVPG